MEGGGEEERIRGLEDWLDDCMAEWWEHFGEDKRIDDCIMKL